MHNRRARRRCFRRKPPAYSTHTTRNTGTLIGVRDRDRYGMTRNERGFGRDSCAEKTFFPAASIGIVKSNDQKDWLRRKRDCTDTALSAYGPLLCSSFEYTICALPAYYGAFAGPDGMAR
jgi:hypothetical protein